MKKVQGEKFGVRFYRRGIARAPEKKDTANVAVQDNVYSQPQPPKESVETMSEIFEPAIKPAIHAHQEHTAPKDKTKVAITTTDADIKERMLWAAAKEGDLYAIRLLVMDGVDLDARDSQGRTAINIATQYGKQNALKTLLAAKEMRTMAKLGELPETKFFSKFQKRKTGTE